MKKFTVAALALTTLLSGSAFAHEAGEFFMRAGPATVRPTEGAGGTLGHLTGLM
ncbi:outer membrane protein W [Salmonella enterica subsp. enterica serovar Kentucky str. ATCC 9263]|nr:outer membrane protein W [Salmonella enterica subsp. enterica serovar Kentucky str. ATCC 9263]